MPVNDELAALDAIIKSPNSGLLEKGNIDLHNRPTVRNQDGSGRGVSP